MKIYLDSVGCRLNQSEIEGFANILRALGHQIVGFPAGADLAMINTCAVTVKAAADSRKALRRAARSGARQVIATGCWVTLQPETAFTLQGVTEVFANEEKSKIISSILGISEQEISRLKLVREPLPGDRARTRAFIKVQEGCDNHCTYCVTRIARGKSQSRSLPMIVKDIRGAIAGGAQEIVLTGVQLGAWGRDLTEPLNLGDLIKNILAMDGFGRLRLSSIEPWDFNPDYLILWQDKRLCRHLHIPLQSGHDDILKRMGRPITINAYLALIQKIRQEIPAVALTTDVIVGFPGESESEFLATQALINSIGFAGGHVFSYSARPGTPAVKIPERVPVSSVKTRNAILRETFRENGRFYREQFIDNIVQVLWEFGHQNANGEWELSGLTDTYVRVYASSQTNRWNHFSQVKILSHLPQKQGLWGQVLL